MKKKSAVNIDLSSKVAKYFVAQRVKGLSKTKAAQEAGISPKNVANYENMKTYQVLEQKYKDKLLSKLGLDEVADEHVKLIKQDSDRGAKLNAIKFYAERVEPEVRETHDDEKMIVVLRA